MPREREGPLPHIRLATKGDRIDCFKCGAFEQYKRGTMDTFNKKVIEFRRKHKDCK